VKLDELIRQRRAQFFIGIEHLTDEELDEIRKNARCVLKPLLRVKTSVKALLRSPMRAHCSFEIR